MVNVYDESGMVIAQVKYSNNLDYWDGRNCTGRHKVLTKLKNGQFVLIHGTQWQGESDSAQIITEEEAAQEILKSGNEDLFDKWPELKKSLNLIEEEVE